MWTIRTRPTSKLITKAAHEVSFATIRDRPQDQLYHKSARNGRYVNPSLFRVQDLECLNARFLP